MAKGLYREWLEPDRLNLLRGWARNGFTDEQIAKKIGISKQTFYQWKNKYSDFADSLKKGKEIIDNEAEEALIKSALGYSYDEERTTIEDRDGNIVRKKTVIKRHVPPDVTALIYWLNNRRPSTWRNRRKETVESEKLMAETELLKLKADILKTGGDSEELEKLDKILDGINGLAGE